MDVPVVDMLNVSKSSRVHRSYMFQCDIPGLKTMDYASVRSIDTFYLDCQDYRDYFRDPRNQVHKPERFKSHAGKCPTAFDYNYQLLNNPPIWNIDRQPIIYPVDYQSDFAVGRRDCDHIKAQCAPTSNLSFKR